MTYGFRNRTAPRVPVECRSCGGQIGGNSLCALPGRWCSCTVEVKPFRYCLACGFETCVCKALLQEQIRNMRPSEKEQCPSCGTEVGEGVLH